MTGQAKLPSNQILLLFLNHFNLSGTLGKVVFMQFTQDTSLIFTEEQLPLLYASLAPAISSDIMEVRVFALCLRERLRRSPSFQVPAEVAR